MDGTLVVYDKEREDANFTPEDGSFGIIKPFDGLESDHAPLLVNKSVNSKNQKANPVASWKLSNHRINGFAFSPNNRYLAVASEDGSLRIINYLKEQWVIFCSKAFPVYLAAHRPKADRSLHELLRRVHVRLLVAGW